MDHKELSTKYSAEQIDFLSKKKANVRLPLYIFRFPVGNNPLSRHKKKLPSAATWHHIRARKKHFSHHRRIRKHFYPHRSTSPSDTVPPHRVKCFLNTPPPSSPGDLTWNQLRRKKKRRAKRKWVCRGRTPHLRGNFPRYFAIAKRLKSKEENWSMVCLSSISPFSTLFQRHIKSNKNILESIGRMRFERIDKGIRYPVQHSHSTRLPTTTTSSSTCTSMSSNSICLKANALEVRDGNKTHPKLSK